MSIADLLDFLRLQPSMCRSCTEESQPVCCKQSNNVPCMVFLKLLIARAAGFGDNRTVMPAQDRVEKQQCLVDPCGHCSKSCLGRMLTDEEVKAYEEGRLDETFYLRR